MNFAQTHTILTIPEAAIRWKCQIADIGMWSARGRLRIVTGIPPVTCGCREIGGFLEVATADILPLFWRRGRSGMAAYLKRIRPLEQVDGWCTITDPEEGLMISLEELAILGSDAERFEAEEGLVMVRAGGALRYDWEKMAYGLIARATRDGAPASQSELVRWALDWFAEQGDVPDESTARRRLTPLWRELQGQG